MPIPRFRHQEGFTLVELVVVIAIIGILSAGLLAIINPLEQLARARDSARKNTINQLGKVVSAYYFQNNTYPAVNNPSTTGNWLTNLQTTGELKSVPDEISPRPAGLLCWDSTNWSQNNFCYYVYNNEAYVWTNLESQADRSKCTTSYTLSTNQQPMYVYDTARGKSCVKCPGNGGIWVFEGACNATQ